MAEEAQLTADDLIFRGATFTLRYGPVLDRDNANAILNIGDWEFRWEAWRGPEEPEPLLVKTKPGSVDIQVLGDGAGGIVDTVVHSEDSLALPAGWLLLLLWHTNEGAESVLSRTWLELLNP